jgi:sugar phosphate permease
MSSLALAPSVRISYRWVVLTLSWAALTMTSVDRSAWGPASGAVGKHLGVSLAGLGIFATGYYIGYVISNAYGGILADWLGARLVLSCSLFLAGGFMILFGHAPSAALGITFQACIGVFAGCDYSAGVKLISQWFSPKKRGFAMGVFMTATSLGIVLANAIVPGLIATSGWRASYQLFGLATMVVAVLCFMFLRNGTKTDGPKREGSKLGSLLRNRDLLLLGLAGFGALWGTYGFVIWSNMLMVKAGHVSPVQAGGVVATVGISAVIAKPLVGMLTDRFGGRSKLPTIIALGAFVATLLLFGTEHSLGAFLLTAPLLGLTGVYAPLMVTMVANLSSASLVGSAAGATNAVWQLGSAAVPVVIGTVYATTHSFFAAFVTLAIGPLLGLLLMLGVREERSPSAIREAIKGWEST